MCDQSDMIEEAALLIETYSVELANCWRNKPFNRVILARAFAMESLGDKDPSETDPLPHVLLLQRIAYIDQSMRKASCSMSDPFGFVLILDGMPIAHSDNPMNYDDSDLDTLEMRHFNSYAVYQEFTEKSQDDVGLHGWIIENSSIYLS